MKIAIDKKGSLKSIDLKRSGIVSQKHCFASKRNKKTALTPYIIRCESLISIKIFYFNRR